jgi:hypothetical protein
MIVFKMRTDFFLLQALEIKLCRTIYKIEAISPPDPSPRHGIPPAGSY